MFQKNRAQKSFTNKCRGTEIAFVSKNVVGATFCRNITPKIFVGLVNKISILGWFDKIFCNGPGFTAIADPNSEIFIANSFKE